MKNFYLLFTRSSIGEKLNKKDVKFVRRMTRHAYDTARQVLKEKGIKTQVERLVEKYGEDVVFRLGFHDGRYRKPIIIRFIDVDCYGDKYEQVPIVDYADGNYDYRGLTEDSLRAYLKGYNFTDVGSAAGGAVLLVSEGISMERIADRLVSEPRTYTLRCLRKIGKPLQSSGFHTTKGGKTTDEGIVDEMLTNDKFIRKQLLDAGVIKKFNARMMTHEEIAAVERENEEESR
jgi:hypothetical protein